MEKTSQYIIPVWEAFSVYIVYFSKIVPLPFSIDVNQSQCTLQRNSLFPFQQLLNKLCYFVFQLYFLICFFGVFYSLLTFSKLDMNSFVDVGQTFFVFFAFICGIPFV